MLTAAVLIVLAIICAMALQIDDWSRDLTTNRAATSSDATDATLRTLELSASVDDVCQALEQFVERSAAWTAGEVPSLQDDIVIVPLVRTSRLFRFADDVNISLQPTPTGTRVDIASQSRVGKGDLGQNPRNIRELIQALRDQLD